MNPEYLLNLTQTFAMMAKEDRFAIKKFSEKPLEGASMYADKKVQSDPNKLTRRE